MRFRDVHLNRLALIVAASTVLSLASVACSRTDATVSSSAGSTIPSSLPTTSVTEAAPWTTPNGDIVVDSVPAELPDGRILIRQPFSESTDAVAARGYATKYTGKVDEFISRDDALARASEVVNHGGVVDSVNLVLYSSSTEATPPITSEAGKPEKDLTLRDRPAWLVSFRSDKPFNAGLPGNAVVMASHNVVVVDAVSGEWLRAYATK